MAGAESFHMDLHTWMKGNAAHKAGSVHNNSDSEILWRILAILFDR